MGHNIGLLQQTYRPYLEIDIYLIYLSSSLTSAPYKLGYHLDK